MSVAPVMNPSEVAGGKSDRNKRMDVKNRNQMEYLTERTLIRDFIPYPRFLLNMKLTQTARILYALLLDRSKISRNNGWKNEKVILSRLVDTFSSRILYPMLLLSVNHSIAVV